MLNPDDLNDILSAPAQNLSCSEEAEIGYRRMQELLCMEVGIDEYKRQTYEYVLPLEEEFRATEPPDHPVLKFIDDYREEMARKERGFA